MGVKEDIQQLIDEIKQYRDELIRRHDECMRLIDEKSRLVVNEFAKIVGELEVNINNIISNNYLTPPLKLSQINPPKFKYVGKEYPYSLPKTIRNYNLPALPWFEFDMRKIRELILQGDLIPIRNLFYVKYPKDVDIVPDFEDMHWKYLMLTDMYQPYIGTGEVDYSEDEYMSFLNAKGHHLRVNKVLPNHEVKQYFNKDYDWMNALVFTGQIEIYCFDTNESYVIDGSLVLLSNVAPYVNYTHPWMVGDKRMIGNRALIIKTNKGVDVVELRYKGDIEELKGKQYLNVVERTYPMGFVGISMYGESIYTRRLEVCELELK